MQISESLQIALIGFAGTLLGYALSLWRSRIVPWMSLLSISESRRAGELVAIPERLHKSSQESWFMSSLVEEQDELERVHDCLLGAEVWLGVNEDSEKVLKDAIAQLENAKTPDEVRNACVSALRQKGLSDLIQLSLTRQVVTASYDTSRPRVLETHVDKKTDNGRYQIEVGASILHFATEVQAPFNKARLEPFVECVARLDRARLLDVLRAIPAILAEQRRTHEIIRSEAENIVEAQSRWMVHFTISNVGSSPFALFPRPVILSVSGKHIKNFEMECKLLVRSEREEEGWVAADGVQVIAAGSIMRFAAVTLKYEREIDGGRHLRDAYKSGSSIARLKTCFLGKDIPWKQTIRSTTLPFCEEED